MLTQEEIKNVRSGFGHMVDNGYGPLTSVNEIVRVLEVSLENARRELSISKTWREANPGAETIVAFLEPTIRNLRARIDDGA